MRYAMIVALALAGCGESATDPEPTIEELLATARFDVISGADQRDTIEARLQPIAVRLTSGVGAEATALSGVGISFVLTEPDCGSVFAGFAVTDASGEAAEIWTLGTTPKECTMEARAVLPDGTPMVYASASATVSVGRPMGGDLYEIATKGGLLTGTPFPLSLERLGSEWRSIWDRAGNFLDPTAEVLGGPFAVVVTEHGLEYLLRTEDSGEGSFRLGTIEWGEIGTLHARICVPAYEGGQIRAQIASSPDLLDCTPA